MDFFSGMSFMINGLFQQLAQMINKLKTVIQKAVKYFRELNKTKEPNQIKRGGSDEYYGFQDPLNKNSSFRKVSPIPNHKPKVATFETPKTQGINTSSLSSNSPEALNHKIENMLHQKKFAEVLAVLKSSRNISEFRATTLCLFLDLLQEAIHINYAYELVKLLITRRSPYLSKHIIKGFYIIVMITKNLAFGTHVAQLYEDTYKPWLSSGDNSKEMAEELCANDRVSSSFFEECNRLSHERRSILGISIGEMDFEGESLMNLNESRISSISVSSSGGRTPYLSNKSCQMNYCLVMHNLAIAQLKVDEREEAFKNLLRLLKQVEPTSSNYKYVHKTFESMIKYYVSSSIHKADLLTGINEVLHTLQKLSIKPNDVFFNKLIDFSIKNNNFFMAERLFNTMIESGIQPSIVTYNTLIDGYFKVSNYKEAWALFEKLKRSNISADNFTYTTMINGLKNQENPDINRAFDLFEEYKKINQPDQIIYNCLLDACINAGDFARAHILLEEMKTEPGRIKLDEITYNTLIKGCCRRKNFMQAVNFYEEMRSLGIFPNRITFNSLIDTCVKTNKMNMAWRFFDEMMKADIVPDNFTYSIIINGIKTNNSSKDELLRTISILDKIRETKAFKPDEILYNSLIDACIKFNEVNRGLGLYEEMKKNNVEPSSITYGILIKAFGKSNDLVKAFKIFDQMKEKNLKINNVTYGCLLDACVKNERMDLALVLVEKMKNDEISLNTILYTTLIKGFARAGKFQESLNIFNLMKQNPRTLPNLITYNCLLDACVRCNRFEYIFETFEEMKKHVKPDLISYSTLIKGFCKQGELESVLEYFTKMLKERVYPDESLIVLIMEACLTNQKCEVGEKIYNILLNSKTRIGESTFASIIKVFANLKKFTAILNIPEMMKQHKVSPSIRVYSNIIEACFSLGKTDKAVLFCEKMAQEKLKIDATVYAKIIRNAIKYNLVELAFTFFERAQEDNLDYPKGLAKEILDCVNSSSSIEFKRKAEMREIIENYGKKYLNQKPRPKGDYKNSSNKGMDCKTNKDFTLDLSLHKEISFGPIQEADNNGEKSTVTVAFKKPKRGVINCNSKEFVPSMDLMREVEKNMKTLERKENAMNDLNPTSVNMDNLMGGKKQLINPKEELSKSQSWKYNTNSQYGKQQPATQNKENFFDFRNKNNTSNKQNNSSNLSNLQKVPYFQPFSDSSTQKNMIPPKKL